MPHAHARGFPSPCVLLANLLTSVVQDRLILTRSGAGAPELQRGPMPREQQKIITAESAGRVDLCRRLFSQ